MEYYSWSRRSHKPSLPPSCRLASFTMPMIPLINVFGLFGTVIIFRPLSRPSAIFQIVFLTLLDVSAPSLLGPSCSGASSKG